MTIVCLFNFNAIDDPLVLCNIVGYHLDFHSFELPTIIIETGKELSPSHTPLPANLNRTQEYALISPHEAYHSIWMHMLPPLYISLNASVPFASSRGIAKRTPFNRDFPHVFTGYRSALVFNCPICSISLKGEEAFLKKYSKAHMESHFPVQAAAIIMPQRHLIRKNTSLLADFLANITDEYLSIPYFSKFITVPKSAVSISYAKSLLLDGRLSYFTIEKTLHLLEGLFQRYFHASFLWLSPSFLLKEITSRISVLCYLEKLEQENTRTDIQNTSLKAHKSKRAATSALCKPKSKVFISSSSLLEKSAPSLAMKKQKGSTKNKTKDSTTLHADFSISSSSAPSTASFSAPTVGPIEPNLCPTTPIATAIPVKIQPKREGTIRCKYEIFFGKQNTLLSCHFNRYLIWAFITYFQ
ncbi:hypothetical protein DI09_9p310 [Mitosporidium daphniae]|uniref:Uncharacterized protein n=1 Tax=Mitosporidium daphniae TaxID=1485682 RepID=A0A098VLL0_9MICR|nr:uncharacterized protein DI09_9p310 [Mitosporidium daphniae]KGG49948.1 hypothetical protein DI09_9p310 [Mitosporidium daphniae]|eukprot:XP_013236375.1 uncharacterized protein DI09_9p310 [Mitosporidium daphniae]